MAKNLQYSYIQHDLTTVSYLNISNFFSSFSVFVPGPYYSELKPYVGCTRSFFFSFCAEARNRGGK